MFRRIIFGVLLTLVLLAGVATAGYYAYQMGVAQGLADSGKLVVPEAGARVYPYYGPHFGPFFHRPFGFGLLGCLFPLFFILLFFGLLRGLFWGGGRWGWRHHGHWDKGAPPMFEEWHRRAHGESTGQESKPQT
jgi:hypothetical protein